MTSSLMTRGHALIAWPAIFGSSGVMTFQVDQDGVVFQKDLGTSTLLLIESKESRSIPTQPGRGSKLRTSSSVNDCFSPVPQRLVQRLKLNLRGWLLV